MVLKEIKENIKVSRYYDDYGGICLLVNCIL